MPKVRDLGISFIPATMRPLEIGDGAGRDYDCDPSGCSEGPSACIEPSYGDCQPRSTDPCDPSGCTKGASICIEPSHDDPCDPSGCGRGASMCIEPSYGGPPCDPSGCSEGPSACIEPSHGGTKDDKYKQSLSAASIAQLKQQLQHQLGA